MIDKRQRIIEVLTVAMEKPDIANALIQRVINELSKAQPEQEPVAVVSGYYGGQCVIMPLDPARIFNLNTALYTAPPQREWQGLTDEEINTWNIAKYKTLNDFIRSLEAKLKEKNT